MSNPEYLTEKELMTFACKIAKILNNVPISQARYILEETDNLIGNCHTVDIDNPRFKAWLEEFAKSGASLD